MKVPPIEAGREADADSGKSDAMARRPHHDERNRGGRARPDCGGAVTAEAE